jgi:hypothetical protein
LPDNEAGRHEFRELAHVIARALAARRALDWRSRLPRRGFITNKSYIEALLFIAGGDDAAAAGVMQPPILALHRPPD